MIHLKLQQSLRTLLILFLLVSTQCTLFTMPIDKEQSLYSVQESAYFLAEQTEETDSLLSSLDFIAPKLTKKLRAPIIMNKIALHELMQHEYKEYQNKNALQLIITDLPTKIIDALKKYKRDKKRDKISNKSRQFISFMKLTNNKPLGYVIKKCIQLKSNVNHKDNLSRTPIMTLFGEKNKNAFKSQIDKKNYPTEITQAFDVLKHTANLSYKDINNRSVLHHYTIFDSNLAYQETILQDILKAFNPIEELNREDIFGKSPCTYSSQDGNPVNEINIENQKQLKINLIKYIKNTDKETKEEVDSPILCHNIKQEDGFLDNQMLDKNSMTNKILALFKYFSE